MLAPENNKATGEICLLVVEDDPDDFYALEQLLKSHSGCHLEHVETLTSALDKLDDHHDLIFLDLSLPDNTGIDGINKLREVTGLPVVILTGLENEKTAYEALQRGAQDYVVKGTSSAEHLMKTVRYAIERSRLQQEVDETRELIQQQRLSSAINSTSNSEAQPNNSQPLKTVDRASFDSYCTRYSELLEDSLRQRAFKTDNPVPASLRALADELGNMNLQPHDLVEIHTTTLQMKSATTASSKKTSIYNEEGLYMLVGLMGHLCSHYIKRDNP